MRVLWWGRRGHRQFAGEDDRWVHEGLAVCFRGRVASGSRETKYSEASAQDSSGFIFVNGGSTTNDECEEF